MADCEQNCTEKTKWSTNRCGRTVYRQCDGDVNQHDDRGGEGSDLPEPMADGVALIGVDGKWYQQQGYGYSKTVDNPPVSWDGDTTGKEHIEIDEIPLYRVSDDAPTVSDWEEIKITYNVGGIETVYGYETVKNLIFENDDYTAIGNLIVIANKAVASLGINSKGVFFQKDEYEGQTIYVSNVIFPSMEIVQTIDESLLPTSRPMIVNVLHDQSFRNFSLDVQNDIVINAVKANKTVILKMVDAVDDTKTHVLHLSGMVDSVDDGYYVEFSSYVRSDGPVYTNTVIKITSQAVDLTENTWLIQD